MISLTDDLISIAPKADAFPEVRHVIDAVTGRCGHPPEIVISIGCATSAGVANIACGSTCPAGAVYGNYVQVSTRGTYTTILPYPLIANSFTLTAQSNVKVQ